MIAKISQKWDSRTRMALKLFILLSLFMGLTGFSAVEKISLEQVLKGVSENNGDIQEARYDVEAARAQLEQARAALWPSVQAMIIAAPMIEVRGNALASTTNWSKIGPLFQGQIGIVQPLYTFGMISSYKDAAEGQISAKSALAKAKKFEVVLQAKQFYYGLLMATDLEKLVDELVSFLSEAVKTSEKDAKKKSSKIKPHDIYRLKDALGDLEQKRLAAVAGRKTASRAIKWISGVEFEKIKDRKSKPVKFEIKALEEYVAMAKKHRPEFEALEHGQKARASLRDAKRAQSYPVVFFGAFASQGWTNMVDRQPSLFANDPFNQTRGGLGVGMSFNLEFKRHAAEAAQEEAERLKLVAKERVSVPGIELQVKKAFWEMEQAIEAVRIAKDREKMAKRWFFSAASGWSIGITPAKELMEALEGQGKARQNYIETVYQHNLAVANLGYAIGQEILDLKY